MVKKTLFLRTFGCQMNVRDSELIAGLFLERGYKLTDSPESADIVLFNTCSVRKHAEERAISNMALLMHKYNERIYGIVGCTAQALKDKLFKRLPKLDIVCGTGEIARLPEFVKKAASGRVLAINNVDTALPELKPAYRENKKHASVSIMRGCDNFCSYCIVPYVRGRERSRKLRDIVDEVRGLCQLGIRNITLLGQNVNSYREQRACDFVGLLKVINDIDGIEKINFLTSHPKDADIRLFEAMRDLDKIVTHLHLPLQSGSDRILELMNRDYTKKKYLNLVTKARNIIPDLRLTTDVIVGFPTETEKDFNETLSLMKNIRFDLAYIFKYSPRAGTAAGGMKDDVSEKTKKRRHSALLTLQKQKAHEPIRLRSGFIPSVSRGMRKIIVFAVVSLLLISPLAQSRQLSRAGFVDDVNILFLKGDYAGVIKKAKSDPMYYRLARSEKKEILYLMGLSYIKIAAYSQARQVFDDILSLSGSKFKEKAYIGIADAYFYEKDFDKAIKVYEKILDIYPKSERLSSVYYNLGLAYKEKKDLKKAAASFQKVKDRYKTSFEADKVSYLPTYYIIQLGAFKKLENAKQLVRKLRRKRYDCYIQKIGKSGKVLYRVRAGKFSNESYATRLYKRLKRDGFSPKIILE